MHMLALALGLVGQLVPPLVQEAYLKASNTAPNDTFGYAVAVSGDRVVIGAPHEDSSSPGVNGDPFDDSAAQSGAAYVFSRTSGAWTQEAYLKAALPSEWSWFGTAVAISGDTIAVGAPLDNAVTIFVRSGNTWILQTELVGANTGPFDRFGTALALAGDVLVVGAYLEDSAETGTNGTGNDNSARDSGAVYVFERSGGAWSQTAYLKASNTDVEDEFGISVALSEDASILAVGAWNENSSATGINGNQQDFGAYKSGAVYVFTNAGQGWTQEAYVKASNTNVLDAFGFPVALSGETLLVGSHGEDSADAGVDADQSSNGARDSGAVYVFRRLASGWAQESYLKASNPEEDDHFGFAIGFSGETALIGAPLEDGNGVGLDGDPADNSSWNAGAAYVFERSGATWTETSYVKASNTEPVGYLTGDGFGWSLALHDSLAVIGAVDESSAATGVDGDQYSYGAARSGAAYLFALDCDEPVGTSYCTAVVNSTGAAASIGALGSANIATGCLRLSASSLPPGSVGIFLSSRMQGFVQQPGGSQGDLCLGGAIGRFRGPGQVLVADASGSFGLDVDLEALPTPTGLVAAVSGETWNFQAWYRDAIAGSPVSNLTDGWTIGFR